MIFQRLNIHNATIDKYRNSDFNAMHAYGEYTLAKTRDLQQPTQNKDPRLMFFKIFHNPYESYLKGLGRKEGVSIP